jgi:glycosyltransferase involved in cell wall biosynthesis
MKTLNYQPTNEKLKSIYFIGNYLPRKCGIATFTTNLAESVSSYVPDGQSRAIALNDRPEGYDYPERVRFEINQNDLDSYESAVDFLNITGADVVCLQHEFGIFGGRDGDYILNLLEELKMPVVTTLHTVLAEPAKRQKFIMARLSELSARIVVMSQTAIHILNSVYDIPKNRIVYIPHGIPDFPFVDPNYYKEQFNLLGRKVLLTFGLLSENKGIETVLKALPRAVQEFPELTYIVLGATHPQVLQHEGEKYRSKLHQIVQDLHIEDNVQFENRFVSQKELCDYLSAANIYITPYNHENQITSGTLAYAAGAGKAVISTPYWYAKEMLSEGRGRLVPFKNHDMMAKTIIELFKNDGQRHKMRKCAYDFSRKATWKEVARQYMSLFEEVKNERNIRPQPQAIPDEKPYRSNGKKLTQLNIDHLLSLTDDTGLLQHACYTIANRKHGYCTDDNARALIFALRAQRIPQSRQIRKSLKRLTQCYFAFLLHAFNPKKGRFRNFMSYSRKWLDAAGSEDSHGRALWAVGEATASKNPHRTLAGSLFLDALPAVKSFRSPRAFAFSLLGAHAYLSAIPGDSQVRRAMVCLSEKILDQLHENASDDWLWPEDTLTYSNGKLPHALILAGDMLERDDMKRAGFNTLEWLLKMQTENDHLTLVGNQYWYKRNGRKARFDQQPLEANALTEACLAAFRLSGNEKWLYRANMCFHWYLGQNDLNLPVADTSTGGCHDGLQSGWVNQNEGAESTLSWLLSLSAIHLLSEKEDVSTDYTAIED